MSSSDVSRDEEGRVYMEVIALTATYSPNLIAAMFVPFRLVALFGIAICLFYGMRQRQNDAAWEVNKEDLVLPDPPEIIGQGTFGLVLLAEYHGTQVTVKHITPPRTKNRHKNGNDRWYDSYVSRVCSLGYQHVGLHMIGHNRWQRRSARISSRRFLRRGLVSARRRANWGNDSARWRN